MSTIENLRRLFMVCVTGIQRLFAKRTRDRMDARVTELEARVAALEDAAFHRDRYMTDDDFCVIEE